MNELMAQNNDLLDINDFFVEEIKKDGKKEKRAKIPVESLLNLGAVGAALAGVAAKIPTYGKLYTIANGAPGFALKAAKDGTYWGALKNASGVSKMAKLKSATPAMTASSCVAAFAVIAVVTIVEHQIGTIIKTQKEILSFLQNEKQSSIEGDVKMLNEIINKYSCGYENERFIQSNHIIIVDIKRKALANLSFYKKEFDKFLASKNHASFSTNFQKQVDDLLRNFKYYRLSAYCYALASFLDVVFSCETSEEYLNQTKQSIDEVIDEYKKIYDKCIDKVDEKSKKLVESNVVETYGKAVKGLGNTLFKNTKDAGKKLNDHGDKAKNQANEIQTQFAKQLEALSDSKIKTYSNKLEEINLVYNYVTRISCDEKNIYLHIDA